jgi:hypothetical protein
VDQRRVEPAGRGEVGAHHREPGARVLEELQREASRLKVMSV